MISGAKERLVSLGVDKQQINQIVRRGKASQTIEIKAPADGVIATLNIREGGYLSPAQAVISAGPLEEVWVDAEVFERQAHWISQGTAASMTLDAVPGGEWSGRVDYVYPILDPTTRTLRVRLKFPNPDGELKPNMFSNITLKPESDDQVLTVARSSVIHSGGMTRVVLSEGEGKYRSHRVRVGREAGDRVEVLEGLEQGVSVVTSAHFMLDSESSQTADLSRISSINEEPMQMSDSVWAKGSITNLMVGHRMATIEHQPVPEWDWPGMVMDFVFSDEVDLSGLANGQAIDFKMEKTDSGQFQVTEVSQSDNTTAPEVWVEGDITMLMADFGMITVNHQAVDEWQWQAGEMNFTASDDIPLDDYKEGQKVRFLVVKSGTDYVLKKIESAEE
jgi:Cu(I)/Ag(I) efflux system membrane fusion protein